MLTFDVHGEPLTSCDSTVTVTSNRRESAAQGMRLISITTLVYILQCMELSTGCFARRQIPTGNIANLGGRVFIPPKNVDLPYSLSETSILNYFGTDFLSTELLMVRLAVTMLA